MGVAVVSRFKNPFLIYPSGFLLANFTTTTTTKTSKNAKFGMDDIKSQIFITKFPYRCATLEFLQATIMFRILHSPDNEVLMRTMIAIKEVMGDIKKK